MKLQKDTIIYADTDNSDESLERAKRHARSLKLTMEDVRIVRNDDGVDIIAKREIEI